MIGHEQLPEELSLTQRKFVRYPILASSLENPHRLHPYLDIVRAVILFSTYIVTLEFIALMLAPHLPEMSILFIIGFFVAVFAGRIFLRSTRLQLSASGISFPIPLLAALNGRLMRPWTDLEMVDLHAGKDDGNRIAGNVLTFTFKSGGRIDLNITRIPRDDLKALGQALATWSDPSVIKSATSELVSRLDCESDSSMFVFAKKHRAVLSPNFGLSNSEPLTVGSKLLYGKYLVEKQLSAGGYRASYLVVTQAGEHLELHEFDLSVVPDERRQECIQRLLNESERRQEVEIPNLAKLANHYVDGTKFYVAMESYQGAPLRQVVKPGGSLNSKQVASLGLQLAMVVDKAQSQELVLSAIRPDSVIWSASGSLLIVEPGFVCDVITNYSDVLLIDAPYAAPERLAAEAIPASDLYSIGATMYFALTGFEPECLSESEPRAVNKKADRFLSDLVCRLMSRDVEARGSVSQLLHDLGGLAFLTEQQVAPWQKS